MKRRIIVVILAILMMATTVITLTASANNHYSTLSFSSESYEGVWRSYTHSNIQWFATVSSPSSPTGATFNITLFRREDGSSVGTRNGLTRNGVVMQNWNGAGSGERRFYYTKSNDGRIISSPSVVTSSSSTPYSHTMG
ncbi:MAG: hypothetical protein LBC73_05980 [Oscillospiraceae bacterium]|jgi:hypothetical protein|nr:hypothetical protein [Oscillospiraceae bacterium]